MIGPCLFAVCARRVYRESDLDASLERPLKARFREFCHWEILALCLDFSDGEPECHEYALFNYLPDGFRIDVSDKFERVAARFNGLPHGNAGVGGAGHSYSLPVCFIHNRLFFFQGHRRGAIAKIRICPDAGRVDLDKISSVLELYPHLLASFIWRVHEVEVAGSGDRSPQTLRRHPHPRAWDYAFIDGIAKVYIRRPAARQIARRGKARLQV